jgi:hypothetical protein
MRTQKITATKAKDSAQRQRERCTRFAAGAAESIGTSANCLFSLLPYEERVRQAAGWYDACADAMLQGNYGPIDEWIHKQACLAETQHFELEDLLELLRICRSSAIEIDGWDEDVFSAVDDVINEGLRDVRSEVSWIISDDLNYMKEAESIPSVDMEVSLSETGANLERRVGERRLFGRNQLALPIRVRCGSGQGACEEITRTQNVSMRGLYFQTQSNLKIGSVLKIVYPYWTDPGSLNEEYSARVARLDRLPDEFWGVAVEFLQNIRKRTH